MILDVLMPEIDGLETLRQLMQLDRSFNVIMLSCSNEVTTVVEAIRLGALDYLTKPFEKPELDAAFLKVRQKQQLRSENQALREYCEQLTEDLSFLAASPQMLKIRQQILQIAPVDVPVFISGESGVGKEVVARMIHLRSMRRQPAFRQGELRGAAWRTAGVRIVRIRAGSVHRRGACQAGQIRAGQQGHDFPG